MTAPTAELENERERHANNLELFLDLVFVFAVTQIASTFGTHLDASHLGRAALIAALVWWQWSQFTWAGSAVDLQARPATQVLVLCTIPATLTMAIAIPHAFDTSGLWFGTAYLVVQLLVLAMQGSNAMRDSARRAAFVRYTTAGAIAPVAVLVGGCIPTRARTAVWLAAIAIDLVGAIRAAGGEWAINPVHFGERHALFVIISLGETLVAIGASASAHGLSARELSGVVAAASMACILWWTYFAFIPGAIEHKLRTATGSARGSMARDLFTLGHFPIVAGIIGFSVAAKHMVEQPQARLALDDRAVLAAALALVIIGYLHIQWRVVRRLAPERIAAVVALCGFVALDPHVNGVTTFVGTAAMIAIMQTITVRRYARNPFVGSTSS